MTHPYRVSARVRKRLREAFDCRESVQVLVVQSCVSIAFVAFGMFLANSSWPWFLTVPAAIVLPLAVAVILFIGSIDGFLLADRYRRENEDLTKQLLRSTLKVDRLETMERRREAMRKLGKKEPVSPGFIAGFQEMVKAQALLAKKAAQLKHRTSLRQNRAQRQRRRRKRKSR